MTKKEITTKMNENLKEALELMFEDSEIRNAHGGFAIKKANSNKRAFEICYNKRKDCYKICMHKQTAINAQITELADVEEQQNNYKIDNLDTETAYEVMKLMYNNKATNTDEQEKIQKRNEKKRVTTTLEF